ncbi:MAG: helix-turn-helix transcriptional regulator [Pseudomonadota bacterium]
MLQTTTPPKGTPHPADVYVGARLRLGRTLLGMSQEALAQAIGVTFQQVQKYERGTNRISAGRLYRLSKILSTDVEYFFDGLDSNAINTQGKTAYMRRETLELVRAYCMIKEPAMRRQIFDLTRELSKSNPHKKKS